MQYFEKVTLKRNKKFNFKQSYLEDYKEIRVTNKIPQTFI